MRPTVHAVGPKGDLEQIHIRADRCEHAYLLIGPTLAGLRTGNDDVRGTDAAIEGCDAIRTMGG